MLQILELWFSPNKVSTEDEILPPKPTKLTPIFSRKRSEITKTEEDEKNKVEKIENNKDTKDTEKTKEKSELTSKTTDQVEKIEKSDVNETESVDKKEVLQRDGVVVVKSNEQKSKAKVENKSKSKEKSSEKSVTKEEEKKKDSIKRNASDRRKEVSTSNMDNKVKEMPLNPFDFIWDTNTLMPTAEASNDNPDEFSELKLQRNKSILGGKIAKLNENEKNLTFNELINANTFSTNTFASSTDEPDKKLKKKRTFFKIIITIIQKNPIRQKTRKRPMKTRHLSMNLTG